MSNSSQLQQQQKLQSQFRVQPVKSLLSYIIHSKENEESSSLTQVDAGVPLASLVFEQKKAPKRKIDRCISLSSELIPLVAYFGKNVSTSAAASLPITTQENDRKVSRRTPKSSSSKKIDGGNDSFLGDKTEPESVAFPLSAHRSTSTSSSSSSSNRRVTPVQMIFASSKSDSPIYTVQYQMILAISSYNSAYSSLSLIKNTLILSIMKVGQYERTVQTIQENFLLVKYYFNSIDHLMKEHVELLSKDSNYQEFNNRYHLFQKQFQDSVDIFNTIQINCLKKQQQYVQKFQKSLDDFQQYQALLQSSQSNSN